MLTNFGKGKFVTLLKES